MLHGSLVVHVLASAVRCRKSLRAPQASARSTLRVVLRPPFVRRNPFRARQKAPTTLEGDAGSDAFAESPRVHVASVEDEEHVACAAPFVGSPRTRARARAAYVRIFCPNLRRATNPNLTE